MIDVAAMAAEFIRMESVGFDSSLAESKGLHDFVSYVDKKSEAMIVEALKKILPEAGFIAEEGTAEDNGSRFCWVIDPLDGTTNFLHGLPPFAVSIALTDNSEPVAGVVYEAAGKEVFHAWKEGGAYLNNKRISVSSARTLADSLIATGFPYYDFKRLPGFLNTLDHFCRTTHGIRRLGSAAVDLAYVACGRFEAFYEYGLHPWDVAAGIILVREAGGRVTDFSGNEKRLTGDEIVAASDLVFTDFLKNVSKFMHP
jgi:myo-inositol-1(or 4)-monophosphatase